MTEEWTCHTCGHHHRGLIYAFFVDSPIYWDSVPPSERGKNTFLLDEVCVIRDEHFFIRGLIEIPVLDGDGPFKWNVWSSLSRTNFDRAVEVWDSRERVHEPPYFGYLSNDLTAAYPTTLNLELDVITREVGTRPLLRLQPTEHPLALEQRNGITTARVREINDLVRHASHGSR